MENERKRASLEDIFGPDDGARLSVMMPNVPNLFQSMGELIEDHSITHGPSWLQSILEATVEYFSLADAGIITLYDEKTGFDEVVASCTRDVGIFMDSHLRSSEGSTYWCYANKKPRIWDSSSEGISDDNDIGDSLREILIEQQKPDFLNSSLLCCPLLAGDKVLGAIQLEHHADGQYFTELELHLLASFVATPLAKALAQNSLYDSMWKEIRYRRDLYQYFIFRHEKEEGEATKQLAEHISHTLAGLHIALSNFDKIEETDPSGMLQYLNDVRLDIDQALNEVRKLTDLYRGYSATDGFIESLKRLLHEHVAQAGIATHLDADVDEDDLTEAISATLYFAARDALENVVAHSQAKNAYVCLTEYDGILTMTIDDDGCGFSKEQLQREGKRCFGLQDISERLAYVNGSSAVFSEQGNGTKVTMIAPLLIEENER